MITAPRLELEPFATGRKPVIYLAGAIHHVTPEFAMSWRQEATEALKGKYIILDPTADKNLYQPDVNTTAYTPEEIVTADLAMIDAADIVLAEVSKTDIPYHGTSMEIYHAANSGKDVIVWGGCQSYWVRYFSTKIFKHLTGAIEYLL